MRAALFGARNPTNKNPSLGRPETESAVAAAVGPGILVTGRSRRRHSRTSRNPGSLIAGVPASLTSIRFCPPAIRSASSPAVRASFSSLKEIRPASVSMLSLASNLPVTRVSSQAIHVAVASSSRALAEISPRFPIGTETSVRLPYCSDVLITVENK